MIVEKLPLPPVYYHAREASYWREDDTGGWIKINESGAKNFVAEHGYTKRTEGDDANCEADQCLMKIQGGQNVAYVGALAGHDPGVYEMAGNLILVTKGPKFMEPTAGEWPVLARLFEGMFVDGEIDQRPYFYGWLKAALALFRNHHWRASQLLALAGAANSGKSLTQNLITEMFGGRSRKPYLVMTGETTFNSQLFGGEHLVLEDESASVDIRSRMHFGSNIKSLLVNWDQSCHGKNQEAVTLRPIWRMTLSLNDEPERLLVLPPLTSDVRDKIIVLKVVKKPMPMPTDTQENSVRFWSSLVSELPAFMHWLENWTIGPEIADSRYGVRAFQHPELIEKMEETAPEIRLFEMIDGNFFSTPLNREPWTGTAADLSRRLQWETCHYKEEARKMFAWSGACGSYLARLESSTAARVNGRVTSRRASTGRIWTIAPPPLRERHDPTPESEMR
jgi:hypothetical protein